MNWNWLPDPITLERHRDDRAFLAKCDDVGCLSLNDILGQMPPLRHKRFRNLFLAALGLVAAFLGVLTTGRILVIDQPQHADFIVVLSGDLDDVRSGRGLTLLRTGYAQQFILDVPDSIQYGRRLSDAAENYIRTTAPDQVGHIHICTFSGESTREELDQVSKCIQSVAPNAVSAIVVTSNFHTRRALSIARRVLPQYRWSVASASDTHFDVHWWRRREWAKTAFSEWQKLLWWMIVEKWFVHQSKVSSRPIQQSGSGWIAPNPRCHWQAYA